MSFSDRRAGSACAASSNPISLLFRSSASYASLALFKSLTAYCFANMESKEIPCSMKPKSFHVPRVPCCHLFIRHFLTFLTPSLRILSFLSLLSPHPCSCSILSTFSLFVFGADGSTLGPIHRFHKQNLSWLLANLSWLIRKSAGQLSG